jgi:glycosyltransferase involved in cell wall biosynthesis
MSRALRVTVIMPSYNHARFIAQAIDSVLAQDYEPITLLVMDGGSTDGSRAILESYGDRISFVSRKDRGQSDAINQGFRLAEGDILCWLNSDDVFTPHAIRIAVDAFEQHPDAGFVYGRGWNIDERGDVFRDAGVLAFDLWKLIHQRNFIQQPSCFFRRSLLDAVGFLDEDLHYVMDWDQWIRFSTHKALHVDEYLSCNRTYRGNKTQSGRWRRWKEIRGMIRRYTPAPWPPVVTLYFLEALLQSLRARSWGRHVEWPIGKLCTWGMAREMSGRYPDGGVAPVFHFSAGRSSATPRAITIGMTPLSKYDASSLGAAPVRISWRSTTGDRGGFSLLEDGRTQRFTLALSRPVTHPFIHLRCRASHPGELVEAGAGLPRRRLIGFLDEIEVVDGGIEPAKSARPERRSPESRVPIQGERHGEDG